MTVDFIVSHTNADFDALASMVAARRLYPEAEAVFPGSQEKKVRDFLKDFEQLQMKKLRDVDIESTGRLIVVDTKSPEKIGPFSKFIGRPGVEVHLYDHHPHGDGDIRGKVEVLEDVGATATIFAEILKEKRIKPTPIEATVLCMGIYEETGNMLFPSTTERDLLAAAWLLRHGASLKIVSRYMKTELTRDELELLSELSHSAKHLVIKGLRVMTAKASIDWYYGEAAHLAHSIMEMEEIDALVLMLRMQDKVLMVGRSRSAELNVAEVLDEFGGGGHPSAASATVADTPLDLLEERLTGVIKASVKPMKVAADIMTKPVIYIEAGGMVKQAEEMMTRYGVNVLPVTRGGDYTGIISREAVEKAIYHGFGNSDVTDFATTDVSTASTGTPVREMETAMIERNQRFMPVLEGNRIVGAITRTDLLRVLYEEYLRRTGIKRQEAAGERPETGKSLASWLKNRFSEETFGILRLAGDTASELNYNAYLVGGVVRDLLRGAVDSETDTDIVVEGDGIEFAKRLGEKLGARVKAHERFGTAKVILKDSKLDVATARTEYYESPASLPTVETSSIKKDLYRRDFTINTLAVKLNPPEFGKLVDFFGAQRDLKEKTIRVLHDLSFVEDPTRALRAVRFSERFGFRLSRHTEDLIKSAIRMDLFERLSGKRLYEELMMTFKEADPVSVIRRFADHGLLGVIHPGIRWDDELQAVLQSTHETLLWFDLSFISERLERKLIYLMALLSGIDEAGKSAAMHRLAVPRKVEDAVIRGIREARRVIDILPAPDNAGIYDTLHGLPTECTVFAMALAPGQERKMQISHYLLELRKAETMIGGEDLKTMGVAPGPIYSEALHETLRERLRGRLKSREDEERFAREYLSGKGAI